MPKTAKAEMTFDQFSKWCKRNRFQILERLTELKFKDLDTGNLISGLYAGRLGALQLKPTVKHLLAIRAASGVKRERKPRAPKTPAAPAEEQPQML